MSEPTWRVIEADCVEAIAAMEASSVDAIVTDPPYNLSFMGKEWDRNLNHGPWAVAALRVLKPGGHLVAFGATRTYHRLACALEDAGFEIRDCVAWLYGSGFPKSLDVSKAIDKAAPDAERWQGWGTALKPSHEPIVLARKPLSARNVAANVLRWGTGALNVDGCRIETGDVLTGSGTPPLQSFGEDNHRPFHDTAEGVNQHEAGRWPANVVLDPEAAAMLDEQTGTLVSGPESDKGHRRNADREARRNAYGGFQGQEVAGVLYGDSGGASRFFYCPKADRAERERGVEHMTRKALHWSSGDQSPGTFQAEGTLREAANHHPTVKPVALMQWLCRLITPPGGLVLDPFVGSGSTGIAALREGFSFVGIEREPDYVEIARARIQGDAPLLNVPAEVEP